MNDLGRIIETSENMARVAIQPHGGCASCQMKGTCAPDEKTHLLWAVNDNAGKVGDEVVVELKPQIKIFGNALVFIFPLIGLFLGYHLGSEYGKTQDYAVLGSIAGIIVFFIIVRIIDKYLGNKSNLKPTITHVLD